MWTKEAGSKQCVVPFLSTTTSTTKKKKIEQKKKTVFKMKRVLSVCSLKENAEKEVYVFVFSKKTRLCRGM